MHNQPSATEMIESVKRFIDETAGPQLSGHAAFHARVASNVLATVMRELEAAKSADAAELSGLQTLLNQPETTDLDALNAALCDGLRSGDISLSTSGLMAHLKSTAIAQLSVDQPKYSGLKTALKES